METGVTLFLEEKFQTGLQCSGMALWPLYQHPYTFKISTLISCIITIISLLHTADNRLHRSTIKTLPPSEFHYLFYCSTLKQPDQTIFIAVCHNACIIVYTLIPPGPSQPHVSLALIMNHPMKLHCCFTLYIAFPNCLLPLHPLTSKGQSQFP